MLPNWNFRGVFSLLFAVYICTFAQGGKGQSSIDFIYFGDGVKIKKKRGGNQKENSRNGECSERYTGEQRKISVAIKMLKCRLCAYNNI